MPRPLHQVPFYLLGTAEVASHGGLGFSIRFEGREPSWPRPNRPRWFRRPDGTNPPNPLGPGYLLPLPLISCCPEQQAFARVRKRTHGQRPTHAACLLATQMNYLPRSHALSETPAPCLCLALHSLAASMPEEKAKVKRSLSR